MNVSSGHDFAETLRLEVNMLHGVVDCLRSDPLEEQRAAPLRQEIARRSGMIHKDINTLYALKVIQFRRGISQELGKQFMKALSAAHEVEASDNEKAFFLLNGRIDELLLQVHYLIADIEDNHDLDFTNSIGQTTPPVLASSR